MGGNVFTTEDFKSKRVDLKDFLRIKNEIITLFKNNNLNLYFGEYTRDKTSFGDLDIIVDTNLDKFIKVLEDHSFKYSKNSNVLSFLYEDFQVDLIKVDSHTLDYAVLYYSWNDIHNLLGKLCKKLGFSHGQNGLIYVIRDHTINSDNRVRDRIYLSNDPYKHLEILQLDVDRYKQGFDSVEDSFDYVMSSPYFNPEYFQLSELTNKDRVRDRKRVNFQKFLAYVENVELADNYIPYPEDRTTLPLKYFPHLAKEIKRVYDEVEYMNKLKAKFNGNVILTLYPDMDGKTIGKVIAELRNKHNDEFWLSSTEEEIDNLIKHHVNNRGSQNDSQVSNTSTD